MSYSTVPRVRGTGNIGWLGGDAVSPEEMEAALKRGAADPTITAVVKYVTEMTAISVGESSGFWTARTCNAKREAATAEFIVEMEKAAIQSEG
jgi:hypothetical protein